MSGLMNMILSMLLLSGVIFGVARITPGIHLKGFGAAIQVAVVYSLIDMLLFRVLAFFSLPFLLITFGLFVFVINAVMLWLTDKILDDFEIEGFGTAILASIMITVGNLILKWLLL
ncbi:Phage holin family protein [Sulfidibacter corallicola]|uniref:Phage holin family protein n=1 Tax=Sulfidibacter corallicola TaxID=2818388 RepID=A0A8A4TM41_SULCO|nr:phage holin family protein [Sulfidibacter corallicola]QTD47665.1 phage holin family protein [Sulfidibacter corallicola]